MPSSPIVVPIWVWLFFAGIVVGSLALDLWTHRGGRGLSRAQAIGWTILWISVALLFTGFVAVMFGSEAAIDYLTAYAIEKSLSVDNLFLFILIFSRLKIPATQQHRVLFWGILGAFVTRAAFIAAGAALLAWWHPVVYILGAFLLYTGWKAARQDVGVSEEPALLPFLRRRLRVSTHLNGHRFFLVENGRRFATPLLLALLAIEATDVVFALDSIPAALAVSETPFIVYSSNVFAVLGLRALYLVVADALAGLKYLRYGLGAVLGFAGLKMLTSKLVPIPHLVSLLVIIVVMVAAIVPSVIVRRRAAAKAAARNLHRHDRMEYQVSDGPQLPTGYQAQPVTDFRDPTGCVCYEFSRVYGLPALPDQRAPACHLDEDRSYWSVTWSTLDELGEERPHAHSLTFAEARQRDAKLSFERFSSLLQMRGELPGLLHVDA